MNLNPPFSRLSPPSEERSAGARGASRPGDGAAARGVLQGCSMHALFFGLKRAYWGSVARSRKFLRTHWPHLTAARFDLMQAIREHPMPILQSKLRYVVGVCRPVVTRMLKALVELGWVTRTRCSFDRRTYSIALTEKGRGLLASADYRIIQSRRAARWAQEGLIGLTDWWDKNTAFWRMCEIDDHLDRLRAGWNASGTLYYPWHPDD